VSAAVALKALEIYARDRVVQKAAERGTQFQTRLKAIGDHPLVGEARGLGLIGGVELVADKKTKRSFAAQHSVAARTVQFAEAEGLIVRAVLGDVLTLSPPLIINAQEVDELFDRLGRALDKTLDWATREKLSAS
jgi:4-aminobutyrate--pyruvate transaminase